MRIHSTSSRKATVWPFRHKVSFFVLLAVCSLMLSFYFMEAPPSMILIHQELAISKELQAGRKTGARNSDERVNSQRIRLRKVSMTSGSTPRTAILQKPTNAGASGTNARPGVAVSNYNKYKYNNNNNNNYSHQRKPLPLIINAGRGTTATHSSFRACCHLGLVSIHWQLFCNRYSDKRTIHYGRDNFGVVPKIQFDVAFDLHNKFRHCVHNPQMFSCPDIKEWMAAIKLAIDRVVHPNSTIQTIHDDPYPQFLPYLVKRTKELRGEDPVLILTERDPEQWTQKRIDGHANGDKMDVIPFAATAIIQTGPPLCLEILHNMNGTDTPTTWGTGEGVFDVLGCMERGMVAHQTKYAENDNAPALQMTDLFVSMANLGLTEPGRQQITRLMDDYQTALRPLVKWSINLFELPEKIDYQELGQRIKSGLQENARLDLNHLVSYRGKSKIEPKMLSNAQRAYQSQQVAIWEMYPGNTTATV